ncbi:MAG: MarR family winged helix-turn-helix transcriptional regulator [Hyphomonadaceae bacterium]
MKGPDNIAAAFAVFTEIAIINQLSEAAQRDALGDILSIAGFGVLNHFVRRELESDSPARLASAFQVTKGAMTYTLQALEEKGFVRIDPDPADGRAKIVRMTKKGRAAREAGIARLAPAMRDLFEEIDARDFAAALPFLTRLRKAMDSARD